MFDQRRERRLATSEEGLVVTRTYINDDFRSRTIFRYLSADRTTPEGAFAQLEEVDIDGNDTINTRKESVFEDGRLTRQTEDRGPAQYNQDDDVGPDGIPESVTTYTYTEDSVTQSIDREPRNCSDGVCEQIAPDGEINWVLEFVYGPNGRPELIAEGRWTLRREDNDPADGIWDRFTDQTYDEHGNTTRVRIDNGANGVWEYEQVSVYECDD